MSYAVEESNKAISVGTKDSTLNGAAAAKKSIFISHKSKDKAAAEEIRKLLKHPGGDLLHVFISERIEAGGDWSSEISGSLERADYLLLLYTDTSEEWDWCLFEAGFFAGRFKERKDGLICLHSTKDKPPKPLRQWQSIGLEEIPALARFLGKLFTGIHKELAGSEHDLKKLARDIISVLHKKTVKRENRDFNTKYITLTLNSKEVDELKQTGLIPGSAVCGSEENERLDIFGFRHGECTLERLKEGLEEHYRVTWLRGLGECLRAASLGKEPLPQIPVLYSLGTKKQYYVVLHYLDKYTDGSGKFCVIFIEMIPEDKEQDENIRLVGDMLKLGRKFRWKVLTTFRREISVLKRYPNERKVNECLEKLRNSLEWIMGEAIRLDLRLPEDVIGAFRTDEDKEKISQIIEKRWPDEYERLVHGIEHCDLDEIMGGLDTMLELNKDYLIIASGRYQQLLSAL